MRRSPTPHPGELCNRRLDLCAHEPPALAELDRRQQPAPSVVLHRRGWHEQQGSDLVGRHQSVNVALAMPRTAGASAKSKSGSVGRRGLGRRLVLVGSPVTFARSTRASDFARNGRVQQRARPFQSHSVYPGK